MLVRFRAIAIHFHEKHAIVGVVSYALYLVQIVAMKLSCLFSSLCKVGYHIKYCKHFYCQVRL